MKTSIAIGALALAAFAGSAQASFTVTWLNNWVGNQPTSFLSERDPDFFNEVFVSGATAGALGSHTLSDGAVSATYTNTPLSFSMSGSGGPAWSMSAYRLFTISGLGVGETVTAHFNLNLSLPGIPMGGGLEKWNPDLAGGAWNPPPFFTSTSTSVQLSNGTYLASLVADPLGSSSLGNGETIAEFVIVPTPGAAAVLGLGGLLAARRRR